MPTPPRRRSRRLAPAAAPSPDTPPPTRLLDLPTELLARALSRCDPADIARVAAVSLLFHASLALEGIRLWAQERGFELPAQPEGEGCAVRWLCFVAMLCESNPPARAAAGDRHSLSTTSAGRSDPTSTISRHRTCPPHRRLRPRCRRGRHRTDPHTEPGESAAAPPEAGAPEGGDRGGGGAVGRQRVSRRTGRPRPEGPG